MATENKAIIYIMKVSSINLLFKLNKLIYIIINKLLLQVF